MPGSDRVPQAGPGVIPDTAWEKFLAEQGVAEVKDKKTGDEEPEPDNPEDEDEAEQPEDDEREEGDEEAEEEAEPESEQDPIQAALAKIDSEIASVNKKLAERTEPAEKPGPKEPEPEIPAAIKALLSHEDAAVREGAREILARQETLEKRLDAVEGGFMSSQIEAEAARVEAEIVSTAREFGLTSEQVDQVADYLESDPNLAATLTFKEGMLRVFPDAKAVTPKNGTSDAGAKSGERVAVKGKPGQRGASVTESGGNAGMSPRKERAPEGESMEQAVARGASRLLPS